MKKVIVGLLLFASAASTLTSCRNEDLIPVPDVVSTPLIFPKPSSDSTKTFLEFFATRDADDNNPVRPVFEFSIDVQDKRDIDLKAVQVYKSFRRGATGLLGPRVLVGEYSTFPATISLNSQEILTDLKLYLAPAAGATLGTVTPVKSASNSASNPIFINDQILFTFEYVLNDGQHIILTPLTTLRATNTRTMMVEEFQVATGTLLNAPYSIAAVVSRP